MPLRVPGSVLRAPLAFVFLFAFGLPQAATPVITERLEASQRYVVERSWAGRVESRRSADLAFEHAGEVSEVLVDAGERVQRGQALATLEGRRQRAALAVAQADLEHARAQVDVAQADLDLAVTTAHRHRDLVAEGHIPQQQWDETRMQLRARQASLRVAQAAVLRAEAAVAQLRVDIDDLRLLAPFDGIVQTRHLDEGDMAQPGQAVLRVVQRAQPEARIGLPFDVAGELRAGRSVDLLYQGRRIQGRLRGVLPEVDPQTRNRIAVVDLEQEMAAGGDLIELTLQREVPADGFWIPIDALSEAQRGLWAVYTVNDDSRIERRIVEVVHVESDRAYIRGTVGHGDQVVVTGTQRLVPEQVVAVVPQTGSGS